MKYAALLIALVLLVSCSGGKELPQEPQQVDISYSILASNQGIQVENTGEGVTDKFSLEYNIYWYDSVIKGPIEDHTNFTKEFDGIKNETQQVSGLMACVPTSQKDEEAYNIYKCELKLKHSGNVLDSQIIYVYFGGTDNPGEYETYLLGEGDYLNIRSYVEEEHNKLQGNI